MPDFAYIARDMQGQKVVGTVSATTEREALNVLSNQSLFPISVAAKKKRVGRLAARKVKGQLMANTYAQMAALLRSGVPLLRTIAVLRDQSSNEVLKAVMDEVHNKVEDGLTLADAMDGYPRVFTEMCVNIIRAGGEGGFLEDSLERVAQFTEHAEDLKGKTMGALAYPGFLAVMGSAIVAALIIFFVPKFSVLFDNLRARGELPAMTDLLLAGSQFVRRYGLVALAIFIGLVVLLRAQLQTEGGKRIRDLIKLKVPLLGMVFKNLAVARFCRVFGTLLRNGVPILKALDISSDAAGNRVLGEAISSATDNISAGESLASPLGQSGHFPRTVVEMISVAEESNSLDTVLVDVADGLERQTSRRLDLAVKLLEPLMLLILAGCVLFVVIALLLPVIKMSNAI